ncbi:hypothetical protein [Aeromonas caviae]|nr:hypothetical protein [Aeromonas caviae]WEE23633.1 hypothetical protein PY772_09370 [Aeromonas caviae]
MKPGYDLIRDAFENPDQRPPRIMVVDGSKPVGQSLDNEKAP